AWRAASGPRRVRSLAPRPPRRCRRRAFRRAGRPPRRRSADGGFLGHHRGRGLHRGSFLVPVLTAIRSIVTYVAVSLYVILMGPPCLLIAFATGRPLILYRVGLGGVRLGLWLSGIR